MAQTAAARSTARVSGRIPPHNLDAEESLLGAMLLSREAVAAALEARVKPEDFYKPAHGHVFEAIHVLYGQGEPVDPITVAEELRRADVLDGVGGTAALLRIQNSTPVSANAGYYAKIVEDLALLRRLIAAAGEITEMAYDVPDEVGDALDRAESLVFEVAQRRVTDSLRELGQILHTTLDQLEALYDRGSSLTGVPSGYLDLDELLLGFQPSNLIVVAARPGMGKTSFALGGAMHVAIETAPPRGVLLDGDEPPRADPAAAVGRGTRRLDAPATGQPDRHRLAPHQPGRGPPGRGAVLHRRQPELHGHGDAGQVPPHQGPRGRPRPGRRRLPPAHELAPAGREPPGRGGRAVPRPEDPGPRARGAGDGALAAEPRRGDPPGQATHARRPPGERLPDGRHPRPAGRHRRAGDARRPAGDRGHRRPRGHLGPRRRDGRGPDVPRVPERREAGVPPGAGVGPPRRGQRQPPLPRARRLAAPRRAVGRRARRRARAVARGRGGHPPARGRPGPARPGPR